MISDIRVGQGFDIHRFGDEDGRALILGGVTFPGERSLIGHSDADVPAHAITDALLSALQLGDLGERFPDTDPQWAGANSIEMLKAVVSEVLSLGWTIRNASVAIVCEQPKIAPARQEMQQNLGEACSAPVTVTGRRAEGLGAIGRVEGIACWATVVVTR
jgi:2-C-methyl-D-erythritol 2,4-cyclodiphosphate synthase